MLETPVAGRPKASFLAKEFDTIAQRLGHKTNAAQARFLKVPPSVLWKIRKGDQPATGYFIAAVKIALPRVRVERLFTFGIDVEDVEDVEDAA